VPSTTSVRTTRAVMRVRAGVINSRPREHRCRYRCRIQIGLCTSQAWYPHWSLTCAHPNCGRIRRRTPLKPPPGRCFDIAPKRDQYARGLRNRQTNN
jgi:hypothetical protein